MCRKRLASADGPNFIAYRSTISSSGPASAKVSRGRKVPAAMSTSQASARSAWPHVGVPSVHSANARPPGCSCPERTTEPRMARKAGCGYVCDGTGFRVVSARSAQCSFSTPGFTCGCQAIFTV